MCQGDCSAQHLNEDHSFTELSRSALLTTVKLDNAIAALATYVGHAKVSDTYWYLTGIPDLMAVAASRFGAFASVESCHG